MQSDASNVRGSRGARSGGIPTKSITSRFCDTTTDTLRPTVNPAASSHRPFIRRSGTKSLVPSGLRMTVSRRSCVWNGDDRVTGESALAPDSESVVTFESAMISLYSRLVVVRHLFGVAAPMGAAHSVLSLLRTSRANPPTFRFGSVPAIHALIGELCFNASTEVFCSGSLSKAIARNSAFIEKCGGRIIPDERYQSQRLDVTLRVYRRSRSLRRSATRWSVARTRDRSATARGSTDTDLDRSMDREP